MTRVRSPTEIVQMNLFIYELFYFGWICSGGFSSSDLKNLNSLKDEGRGTRNGYEASKGSKGISGL